MEHNLEELIDIILSKSEQLEDELKRQSDLKGLTVKQLHCIQLIEEYHNPTLTELAANLGITKPSVTVLIEKLVDKGFVIKVKSDTDRRSAHLHLDFFDWFQFISLVLFLGIFIGRSVWLQKKGVGIFVIGKGKGGVKAIMEIVFIAVLVLWVYEILNQSLGLSFTVLPAGLSDPFVRSLWFKIAGAILIFLGIPGNQENW